MKEHMNINHVELIEVIENVTPKINEDNNLG